MSTPQAAAPAAGRFSVTVAGVTGTHVLDLARQLAARCVLAAYYTTLPPSRTSGIPPHLVERHALLLGFLYAATKGWLPMSQKRLYRIADGEFDRWIGRRLVRAEIAHAVAGLGRRHQRLARERFGAAVVCDSPTTHVRHQQELLNAEHDKWRVPRPDWDEPKIAGTEEEYAASDLILAPSRFAYASFVARGIPASKLAVVPYGVDLDEYRPMPKPDGTFRILYVGTLSLRKGLPYLLEAVGRLRWPDAELVLRGAETPESIAMLQQYRGTILIRRVPPQPRSALKYLYSSASVLVLPSIEDGFGLVITQALACATPVIATTSTGGPDVIESGVNGFLIPPADTAALLEALQMAYDRRAALREMGVEARRRIERGRGWGQYGDGVVAAFARALECRAGGRPVG